MTTTKPKIIVILGPTATGKSDLAVKLAQKFHGEVISADSRQVYIGLDLGSDKVPNENYKHQILNPKQVPNSKSKTKGEYIYKGVRHHLIDVTSPKRRFAVTKYKELAEKVIGDILKLGNPPKFRGAKLNWARVPIICGGTGLYIDTLIYDRKLPAVKPNLRLRQSLEKKTAEELFERLRKLDPKRAGNIDRFNKRRLIRALEIVVGTGRPTGILRQAQDKNLPYKFLKIGITVPAEELKRRIKKRTLQRLRGGVIREMENLRKAGVSDKKLDEVSLYYRWARPYLRGEVNQEKTLELISTKIWQYAKRQMTWFKRDKSILWVKNFREAEKAVNGFLKS